jgi:hypothetical protein
MPKKELKTKNKEYESEEDLQQRRFKTTLEWMGWGSIATLIALLVAWVSSAVHLDYQSSAMIMMTIYFWAVSWGIGKLIKDSPAAWKHYFHWWTVAVILGGILLTLGVTIVPT